MKLVNTITYQDLGMTKAQVLEVLNDLTLRDSCINIRDDKIIITTYSKCSESCIESMQTFEYLLLSRVLH